MASGRTVSRLILALAFAGCAHGGGRPPEDATRDPEFQAALRRARPDFPRQREALAAGVYETFVPPESLAAAEAALMQRAEAGPMQRAEAGPEPGAMRWEADVSDGGGRGAGAVGAASAVRGEDPTTEELLGTLPASPDRQPAVEPEEPRGSRPVPAAPEERPAAWRPPPAESGEPPVASSPAAIGPGGQPVEPPAAGAWTIQAGAFADPAAAAQRVDEARSLAPGLAVEVAAREGLFKVRVGSFASRADAEAALQDLVARGLGAAWVTRAAD